MKSYIKVKKTGFRLIVFTLAAACLIFPARAIKEGFDVISGKYVSGMFSDVGKTQWFSGYIEYAYNYGLLHGKEDGTFDPEGMLTFAEAVKLAATLRSKYLADEVAFEAAEPYYIPYASYALENGIIKENGDYNSIATRAQFAELIYNSLPDTAFAEINSIPENGICDVVSGADYSGAVYALYRAGVIVGSDKYGSFFPDSAVTRAEACAVITRVIRPEERLSVSLPSSLSAEMLYERSANAVFMIETYDEKGEQIRIGSGFFINKNGLAATNEHVIAGATNAIITLSDERKYPVLGINAINAEYDLAIIEIDYDEGELPYLNAVDSEALITGAAIYALGSPQGLHGTISTGVVSNPFREIDEKIYFQFTAPISFGSGGGPVINALGQVVGVACSSFAGGEFLNLAVPIHFLNELEPGPYKPISEYKPANETD